MDSFKVEIQHDQRREVYEMPQISGLHIDRDEVELVFDPVHSDTMSLACSRDDLITVDIQF